MLQVILITAISFMSSTCQDKDTTQAIQTRARDPERTEHDGYAKVVWYTHPTALVSVYTQLY